jgi:hypothetical protein
MKSKLYLDQEILLKKQKIKEKIYVDDIKYTLKKLNLNNKGKKQELLTTLINHYNKYNHYTEHIDKIKFIQTKYRTKIISIKNNFYKQFTNSEDFYTLDSIDKIEKPYLFWFEDNNKFKFAFDIRSFKNLINNNCKNPYNREEIPFSAILKYQEQLKQMKKNNIKIIDSIDILTTEQKRNLKIVRIFQKLDELNIVAGGINQQWFHNFSFYQLKKFYRTLEDVWNYRSELSHSKKLDIVPNNNLFLNNMYWIINLTPNHFVMLQDIVLNEIETLISSSENLENRKSGGFYVLISLTEVSLDYADDYPWLQQ